jgi:hypothetical protein
MTEVKEFIDLIYPEHSRTSCSDENIYNGFYLEDDFITIDVRCKPRCKRCAFLEIENGTIKITEENKKIIPDLIERY